MTTDRTTIGCPDAGTLSAFAEGRLADDERARVIDHLLACEQCYAIIRELGALREEIEGASGEGEGEARPFPFRRIVISLAAAAALAALVLLSPIGARLTSQREPSAVRLLASAIAEQRPIEPRVAGFDHAPLRPVTRGPGDASYELLAAAAKIESEAADPPTPSQAHALGLAKLLLGEWDEAIELLEGAAKDEPTARHWNDLAAAYLARAQATGEPADAVDSIEFSSRALAIDPNHAPAAFNRALALEGSGFLEAQAIEAWEHYLTLDAQSDWATEARRHLAALRARPARVSWEERKGELEMALQRGDEQTMRRIVAEHPARARRWTEKTLLPFWGKAALAGDERIRSDAAVLATILASHGDPLLSRVLDALERSDDRSRLRLARAAISLGEARTLYEEHEYERAQRSLTSAAFDWPLRGPAAALEASIHYVRRNVYDARSTLDGLPEESDRATALSGEIAWVVGLALLVEGRPFEALASFRHAAEVFTRLGDRESLAAVRTHTAHAMELLGQDETAWREHVHAARDTSLAGSDGDRRHVAMFGLTRLGNEMGKPHLASLLSRLLGDDAIRDRKTDREIDALLESARANAMLGASEESIRALERARRSASAIDDLRVRDRSLLFIARAAVQSLAGAQPELALAEADQAIRISERIGDRFEIARSRLLRGRLLREAGRERDAELDFDIGIGAIETAGAEISDTTLRISHFDTASDLFDELAALRVHQGRYEDALAVLARSRGASLRNLTVEHSSAPLANASPNESVPIVLAWSVQDHRSILLVRRGELVEAYSLKIGNAVLQEKIERFRAHLDDRELAAELYDALLAPAREILLPEDVLILVPDKSLHGLPFAALYDRKAQNYLVERHTIAVSATPAVRGIPRWKRPESALVIGNPAVRPSLRRELPDLPAAARETREIAALYGTSRWMTGSEALAQTFLASAPDHDVIHFAGHTMLAKDQPEFSGLVMAAPDGTTLVTREEILSLDLRRSPIVVLAACGTGDGRPSLEGSVGIAQAFLSAGAVAVVATLGAVEDPSTALLSANLHRSLAAGVAPAHALRAIQTDMLRSTDPAQSRPAAWARTQTFLRSW